MDVCQAFFLMNFAAYYFTFTLGGTRLPGQESLGTVAPDISTFPSLTTNSPCTAPPYSHLDLPIPQATWSSMYYVSPLYVQFHFVHFSTFLPLQATWRSVYLAFYKYKNPHLINTSTPYLSRSKRNGAVLFFFSFASKHTSRP